MDIKIEKELLTTIIPYANNAKLHPQNQIEQIKASILEFGFNDPIAIDEKNIIIEGHGRFIAVKQLGYEFIPVIRLCHLTEVQKKQYILAHNKITLNSGFNEEILKLEIASILELNGNIEIIGFNDLELQELKIEVEAVDIEREENIIKADSIKNPISQKGDLWILGTHRLLCGDSTLKDDVETLMKKEKADLMITDPPYNIDYEGATSDKLKIANDNMSDLDFYNFLLKAYKNMFDFSKNGAPIYVFHSDSEVINFRRAFIEVGFYYSQSCIWVKNQFVMGRQDYHWQHEPIIVGWKPGKAHSWYSDRKQSTIWNYDKPLKNDIHPTIKPLEILVYPIKNSSNKGEIVLDLFGGSGSTLIACEMSGRKCRTMELDPRYIDVIVERYKSLGKDDIYLLRDNKKLSYEELKGHNSG